MSVIDSETHFDEALIHVTNQFFCKNKTYLKIFSNDTKEKLQNKNQLSII